MTDTATAPVRAAGDKGDKREAILAAALRLLARFGLHNTPMSAVAREARVAAGTLYLYFESKEAMINALYLELLADRTRAIVGMPGEQDRWPTDPREALWKAWYGHARWDLERADASNVLRQCQTSGILTEETREGERRIEAESVAMFHDAVERGLLRPMTRQLFWALSAGPIFALAQMRESGELEITDDVLRATFDGVCRSVLPPDALP
jgi:AcrR family transcriptional regulator